MLDALNGDGGAFWEDYAERILPQPASLSIPFCLDPSLLGELQHQEISDGAAKQQVLMLTPSAVACRCYVQCSTLNSIQALTMSVFLHTQAYFDMVQSVQDRLARLFPGLDFPMPGDGATTYMQWALACVRSRAFQLSKDRFAFVPFLDIANHSSEPNAAFRASKTTAGIELVVVSDVDEGQEAVISYTERSG